MQAFIEKTIRKAGKEIMTYFGHAEVAYAKKDMHDVVTHADLASNKIITGAIRSKFPDHAIVSEEDTDTSSNEEYKWYVDPLDGTKNFSTHVPLFGIIIALSKNGVLTHGAIYLPYTDELVYAEKGKGAWLNGKRLPAVTAKKLFQTYGLMNAAYGERTLRIEEALVREMAGKEIWINHLGSMAVPAVYMATMRRDWQISTIGCDWDYAGPVLIFRELGYQVSNMDGKDWQIGDKGLVSAHPDLHQQLISLVKTTS